MDPSMPMVFSPDITEALEDSEWKMDAHTTASIGDMEYLISLNFELDCKNKSGWTPLMYASYYDHFDVVHFLIISGSNPVGVSNYKSRTAIMMAAMCGNEAIVKFLIRKFGADSKILEEKDEMGMTPLFHAVDCGHDVVTQIMLEAGSNPDAIDHSGYTPLMIACQSGNTSIVRWLVLQGANISYSNKEGEDAKSIAMRNGYDGIVKFLSMNQKYGSTAPMIPSVLDGPTKLREKIKKQQKLQFKEDSVNDVKSFLTMAGVEKYQDLFESKNITLEKLLAMNDDDIKVLGISLLGPRRKLTSAILKFKASKELIG